eukprot:166090-Prymnesium_polylepis.1
MPFDELLRHLKRVLWLEGQPMTSLADVVGGARGASTHIQVHVGGAEKGDVLEAEMLREAAEA